MVETGGNKSLTHRTECITITGAHEDGLCEYCGEKETRRACNTIVQKYDEEKRN